MKLRLVLSSVSALVLALSLHLPALARPAVLTTQEAGSRINVRSGPSISASTPHYGLAGDRIETLDEIRDGNGDRWYYVRFSSSNAEGWVRADFVRFLDGSGNSSNSGNNNNVSDNGDRPSGSVPEQALNVCRDRVRNAYPRLDRQDITVQPSSQRGDGSYSVTWRTVEDAEGFCRLSRNGQVLEFYPVLEPGDRRADETTVVSFQTDNHAVRIFRRDGGLRLNLFNKRSNRTTLQGVPVEQTSNDLVTRYIYRDELPTTIEVERSGQRWLNVPQGQLIQRELGY